MIADRSMCTWCASFSMSTKYDRRRELDIQDIHVRSSGTNFLQGRVRRTTTGKNGFVVALEFDEPVQAAEMLGGGAEAVLAVSEDNGSNNVGSESFEATDDAADEEDTAPKKRKPRKG